jgi:hypothetical protein
VGERDGRRKEGMMGRETKGKGGVRGKVGKSRKGR